MDELFKQNLARLRAPLKPKTFSEVLAHGWVFRKKIKDSNPQDKDQSYSEKAQVLDSLNRFAQEIPELQEGKSLRVEGGELAIKPSGDWPELLEMPDLASLTKQLSLPAEILNIVLKHKAPQQVKVLFITENFRAWEEIAPELKGGLLDELLCGFPVKTAELFERMIVAMKLEAAEVIHYPVEDAHKDLSLEAISLAAFFGVEVVITLGAKATQKILKTADRLTLIHGQFFQRQLADRGSFTFVPLFHPSIIETNQNMKKTAWTDMQKIMRHLKKLQ
jgi:uracil-DNA glycosylase family 4